MPWRDNILTIARICIAKSWLIYFELHIISRHIDLGGNMLMDLLGIPWIGSHKYRTRMIRNFPVLSATVDLVKMENNVRAGVANGLCVRDMMTSSNGNNFRVTGPLCGEFTGHRCITRTKASDAELWCFLWFAYINGWVNNREAGDLIRYRTDYGVTVMRVLLCHPLLELLSCEHTNNSSRQHITSLSFIHDKLTH